MYISGTTYPPITQTNLGSKIIKANTMLIIGSLGLLTIKVVSWSPNSYGLRKYQKTVASGFSAKCRYNV